MGSCMIEEVYKDAPVKEIWRDVTKKNIDSLNKILNRKLMREIEKNKEKEEDNVEISEVPIHSKQMWDSEKGGWVPFSLWGAHFIVNNRKEYLALRIYRHCNIQPEFGSPIKGWLSLDSSYLNERLKERDSVEGYDKEIDLPKITGDLLKTFAGYQAFYTMVKQDKEEYESEFRWSDYPKMIGENI